MNVLIWILGIVYCIWSVQLGVQFVRNNFPALDEPGKKWIGIILAIVIGLGLGSVLIALNIIKWVFNLINHKW